MDSLLERRTTAHARAAARHDSLAEFHFGVARMFEDGGNEALASAARRKGDAHAKLATRERVYALDCIRQLTSAASQEANRWRRAG